MKYDSEDLKALQSLPLCEKVKLSKEYISDWYSYHDGKVCVSYSGGKDSTTLLHLVRSVYPEVPAIYVDNQLDYPEVRDHVKATDNVICLKPEISFEEVIEKYGWCYPSKEVATYVEGARQGSKYCINKLNDLNSDGTPSEHKIKFSKWKWLVDTEEIKISGKCGFLMKIKPINKYLRETKKAIYTGELASESLRRRQAFYQAGINNYGRKSKPITFWTEQDILRYIVDNDIKIPSVYGSIIGDKHGKLKTTGESRTGCIFCPVGCHLDKRNKFERLKVTHPELYQYAMRDLGLEEFLNEVLFEKHLKENKKVMIENTQIETANAAIPTLYEGGNSNITDMSKPTDDLKVEVTNTFIGDITPANILRPSISDDDVADITRMSRDEQDALKLKIKQFDLRAILPADKRGDGFICPICGNGSGHTGDGIKPKESTDKDGKSIWLYHCFARGDFEGDFINIIATVNSLDTSSDFHRILAIGKRIIENPSVVTYAPPPNTTDTNTEYTPEQLEKVKADIESYAKDIDQLPVEDRRGITLDTYKHFNCGFTNKFYHPTTNNFGGRRIIIPTSEYSYNAILPLSDRNDANKKQKCKNAGHKHIFNAADIVPNKAVIVVEGEFDAMSIWQASSVNVIAIGGASSHKKFLEYVEEKIPADSRKDYQFIVLFDTDNTGIAQAKKLTDALIKLGCPAISDFLVVSSNKIDANDILIQNGDDALKSRVEEIINSAQIEFVSLREEILLQKNINNRISEYEEIYGAIKADTQKEIKQAIQYLNGFTSPKDLTAEIITSLRTPRYLAICYEYGFADVAESFLDKAAMATHFKFSRPAIMKEVTAARKHIHKAQEKYVQDIAQQQEKNQKAQQEKQYNGVSPLQAKIAELKLQPASRARDKKIIELIKSQCEWDSDKQKKFKGTQKNFDLIFDNDPFIDGLFGYNAFSHSIVFTKQPYWQKESVIGENWTETDSAEFRVYLRRNYEEIPCEKITDDSVISLGNRNAFHPVKQYIENLKWDGVPRAEEIFIKFLGVEDSEYSREITMNWLLGAMARIYYPACDFQNTPVLQGAQGTGKTRIIKALAKKWYVSLSMDCSDSHAIDAVQNAWIVELEENAAYKRTEVAAMKSFLTRTFDTNRFAFCKKTENRKRHCVFVMTNNNPEFLKDTTGNRRFRILKCRNTTCEFEKIMQEENFTMEEYTDQIWAEVKVKFDEIFKNGFDAKYLQLSQSTHEQAEEIAEDHMIDDGLTTEIKSYLDTPIPRRPIWLLLSKDERRKFFAESHIILSESDLLNRLNSLPAKFKKDTDLEKELADAIAITKEAAGRLEPSRDFYGQELRQHICAAEIYNECFGQDRRKSMTRISEVLTNLEGWTVGKRLQGKDPQFTDQRKPYYRIVDEKENTSSSDETPIGFTDDDFSDEVIPDSSVPFTC